MLLNQDGKIDRSTLPLNITDTAGRIPGFDWGQASFHEYLDRMEERILREALAKVGWNKRDAALLLKIPLPTLKSKLMKFHLSKAEDVDLESHVQ